MQHVDPRIGARDRRADLPRVDLQSHSRHSDGDLAAAEVVAAAAAAGVQLLALSDHDTVDGVDEALEAAAAHGIDLLAATEISAVDGGHEDLHVLGYGIDHHDARLLERLHGAREDREARAERMAALLAAAGYAVDDAPLAARREAGKPVGRPHLAAAVLGHPDNAEQLAREGHADVTSFIRAYLIPGMPAYAGRTRPTVGEAIEWIHDAGGLAFWAHPFWDIADDDEVLAALERHRGGGTRRRRVLLRHPRRAPDDFALRRARRSLACCAAPPRTTTGPTTGSSAASSPTSCSAAPLRWGH